MPFKSQAQRAYLHIHHPDIADLWEKHTPKGTKLPAKVKSKSQKAATKTAALTPLLRRWATQIASMDPVEQAMTQSPPIMAPGLMSQLLRKPTPGQILAQNAPQNVQASAQGVPIQKTASHTPQRIRAFMRKLAGLKPPMPRLPTPPAMQNQQRKPSQIAQVPSVMARIGLAMPGAANLAGQAGGAPGQGMGGAGAGAGSGASAVGPGASAASGMYPQQGPHVRQPFNQKSVFGAGPLSNTGIAGVGMNLNPVHAGLAMKQANQPLAGVLGDLAVKIDRPKGHVKTFQTPSGPKDQTYPVDYGYFDGVINPDDGQGADVFVGSGGPHYGRFMKGTNLSGSWQPDERKWYAGLSDEELAAVRAFFEDQSKGLTQDWTTFKDHNELQADLPRPPG